MLQDTESSTLQDKAVALKAYLNDPEWLQVIGIGSDDGNPCIYVYANKLRSARALVPNIWCDVPVKVRKLGKLSLCNVPRQNIQQNKFPYAKPYA